MVSKASDHWTSFEEMDRESQHAQKINQILTTANFDYLRTMALHARCIENVDSDSRTTSESQKLTCTVDRTKFAAGWNNVVFEMEFSDGSQMIARVCLPVDESTSDYAEENSILSEIATMKLIASRTNIPVPRVYGFEVDPTNAFGFRYILMQALPGHHLEGSFATSIPRASWDKVIDQLSNYWYQLSCLRFDCIGRPWYGRNMEQKEPTLIPVEHLDLGGPFSTSLEYFHTFRRACSKLIRAAHPGKATWEASAWILEQTVPSIIIHEYMHGPFPVYHMDFHYKNILFDDDYNITGVIDWSNAQTVPWERFTIIPEFATYPGLSDEENEPFITFRKMFAASLKRHEEEAATTINIGNKVVDDVSSSRFISDLINTPLWEIVYCSTHSAWWRAIWDSKMVLKQIYGADAKWEDFISYYENGPIHHEGREMVTITTADLGKPEDLRDI